jgi:hypothetical protein
MKKKQTQNQMPIFLVLEKGISRLVERILHKSGFNVFPPGEMTMFWQRVEGQGGSLAIIDADKLVDNVLKKANVRGESMGERLRAVEKLVPRNVYNDMWEAHKIRNRLVHEIDSSFKGNVGEILLTMKRFLIALGAFKND